jgi:hypothetical protein
MTPYVFRKYAGYNQNDIRCWSTSTAISPDNFVIEDIVTSKGSSKAGTSIPSPLARMELFDTAFHIVATDQKNNLKGKTIYHQLVSDVLDMLQLLYNAGSKDIGQGKKIWFREWKVSENINKLKGRGDTHPHYILGKSLEQIFFDRFESAFTGLDSIFLIYYENKLMGGTSPLTLVFTSPNWSRYLSDNQILNTPQSTDGDIFFDDHYRALHERNKDFVEYIYKLLLVYKRSFEKAAGFRKYINKTIELYFPSLKLSLENYHQSAAPDSVENVMDSEYSKILTNVENKFLTVKGLYLYHHQEGSEKDKVEKVSDFRIRATETKYQRQYNKDNEEQYVYPPLVLLDGMNLPGNYMEENSPWNPNTRVRPHYLGYALYERKLPMGNSQSITYPFITTEDFLEDVLIEMPFYINNQKFFSGFAGNFKYLLPVKKEYFNFFRLQDLKDNLSIVMSDGAVKVSLKVPIRNRKGIADITFTKTYTRSDGTIIECAADIGIYPFYQITAPEPELSVLNDYAILLANRIETDARNERISLKFFNYRMFVSDEHSIAKQMIPRSVFDQGGATATSRYYKLRELFDYMELLYQYDALGKKCSGLIIPNFNNRRFHKGNLLKSYTFAIDFGTSNTHVAYKSDDETLPVPFSIDEEDQQMVLLNAPGDDPDLGSRYASYGQFPAIDLTLRREFIPPIISNKSKTTISFPFKTASCEITEFGNIEKSKVGLFSHINIGYYIDREVNRGNIIYTTNLKWLLENSNDNSNKSRVKFFLKQLLLQIKSKTILNEGNPSDLKIVWSVPISMERGNRAALKKILLEAFDEVFGPSCGARLKDPIPEAVAPYFYLTRSGSGIQDIANVINIDIGGGTTDIMMFMEAAGNRTDKFLCTSFRFAGNDIWGSGFKNRLKDNGFIKNYINYQKANNINPDETKYFNKAKTDSNLSSDDLVSLLFRYDESFRFSDSITIGNPDLTLILYLHFSAIIYHIVEILELKGYPLPRYLSFTGKGSQYIRLICGDDNKSLQDFTVMLIKAYTNKPLQSMFRVHLNDNPKEITANGAVMYDLAGAKEKERYESGDSFEFVHPGFNSGKQENASFKEKLSAPAGEGLVIRDILEINSALNISVLNNLNEFLKKTLENREIIKFLAEFKVENLKEAYATLRWNGDIENGEGVIYDSYKKVLSSLRNADKEAEPLPESLFFFGLKDSLYELSKQITGTK